MIGSSLVKSPIVGTDTNLSLYSLNTLRMDLWFVVNFRGFILFRFNAVGVAALFLDSYLQTNNATSKKKREIETNIFEVIG